MHLTESGKLSKGRFGMKRLLLLGAILICATMWTGSAFSQEIGAFGDEAGTQVLLDSHTDLTPNPNLANAPSAVIWVVAYDLSELSGYEYRLTSTDASAFESAPIVYPSTAVDSGTNGDVRVNTGSCFQVGSSEAGPNSDTIRLAKHQFTWITLPDVDVLYCVTPSLASGASMPRYTECVDTPDPLPFTLVPGPCITVPDGCCRVFFEFQPNGVPVHDECGVPVESSSWGSLKAGY
jgi:hypothetical protein